MTDNTIMTGYLKVILGCMFSGKTTELIKEYNRHKACDIRCCFVNHSADDRYGSGTTTTKTHNQASVNNDKSCNTMLFWELEYFIIGELLPMLLIIFLIKNKED